MCWQKHISRRQVIHVLMVKKYEMDSGRIQTIAVKVQDILFKVETSSKGESLPRPHFYELRRFWFNNPLWVIFSIWAKGITGSLSH